MKRDGSTSQNQYRFKKFNAHFKKSYYGNTELIAPDMKLPSNQNVGKNSFWPPQLLEKMKMRTKSQGGDYVDIARMLEKRGLEMTAEANKILMFNASKE